MLVIRYKYFQRDALEHGSGDAGALSEIGSTEHDSIAQALQSKVFTIRRRHPSDPRRSA